MADSTSGEKVLMTVELEASEASLAAAAAALSVSMDDLDAVFGLVPIDPDKGLYAVKVRNEASTGQQSQKSHKGPYSNPKIAPFGLAKKG